MPYRRMLGLLVFCIVTPWIAESISDGNITGAIDRAGFVDDTRREDLLTFSLNNNASQPTFENKNEDTTPPKELSARKFDLPREELTGFETDVPCDNAQFLMKVLTVMMPLLRDEVPASTRTSYILYVLKDLLKTSPEAAQDYEVMYKINDLLMTLEKYHDRNAEGDFNVLRQRNSADSIPDTVKSKVVFKYEVPQLTNPDCTAELLAIIKIVQDSILRLVNNPVCKAHISAKSPILVDVKQYFENPKLYSYDIKTPTNNLPFLLDNKVKFILNQYDILNTGVTGNADVFEKETYYPYIAEDKGTEKSNYYNLLNDLLFQQQQSLYPKQTEHESLYIYPDYPNNYKNPKESPYQYDVSPNVLSIINGVVQPYSSTPSVLDIKLPPAKHDFSVKAPISPIDVFDLNLPYRPYKMYYDYDDTPLRPRKQPKIVPSSYEIDETFQKPDQFSFIFPSIENKKPYEQIRPYDIESSPLPFDVTGYGSGEFQLDNAKPWLEYDWLSPTRPSPSLDVYSDYDSAEIQIGPYRPNRPDQNKHDISPQTLPLVEGLPNWPKNRPKLPFDYYLPNDWSNKSPNINPYNPYWPYFPNYKPHNKKFTPFDVSGDGSGEIQVGPTEIPTLDFYVPKIPNTLPEYYWPENGKDADLDNMRPIIPKQKLYEKDEDNILILEPSTKRPLRPDIESQYVIPEVSNPDDFAADFKIYQKDEPTLWNPYKVHSKILLTPSLTPDNKILLIIKDNLDAMERNIPEEHLNVELREMIRRLRDLLNLKQIAIEEYSNIVDQYQVLVANVKNLNINNAIMKKLLLSMTNFDKLDLPTGKSQVVEFTYLIKRPKPLIYQPYYYIKYHLPYTSFLAQLEKLLAEKPHLKNNPAELYKALISVSKVAETSPDLQKYEKEHILALTFDKGTLVRANIVKDTAEDVDMYMILDKLKTINSDFSVEDVYELMKNLDSQLKQTSDGLVFEESINIPGLNIHTKPSHIHITKVKKPPILQKVTKITTNKLTTNNILTDILNKMNVLRSNLSMNHTVDGSNLFLDDTNKTNNSAPAIGRSRDFYDLNQLNNENLLASESKHYNIKSEDPKYFSDDYLKVFKDKSNYYTENNTVNAYGLKTINSDTGVNWDELYSNPRQWQTNDRKPNLPNQAEWLYETMNAYDNKPTKYKSKSMNFKSDLAKSIKSNPYLADYSINTDSEILPKQRLHPITAVKLLDASLKANKNYKLDDHTPQQYYFESEPQQKSLSTSDIIDSPDNIKSHIVTHSETYINDIPVKHSKSYLFENPNNEVQQLETSFTDPVKYNVENSQSIMDYNPYIANYNINASPSKDLNLEKQSQFDSTKYDATNNLKTRHSYQNYDNLNTDYNSINKPSKSLDINSVQQPYKNVYTDYNLNNKPSKSLNINLVQQPYNNLYTDFNSINKASKSLDINSVQQSYDNLYNDHNSINKPSKSLDINSVQQSYDNVYTDHNSFNKPSKSLDINSVQQSYDNLYIDHNLFNKPSKSLDINSVQQSYDNLYTDHNSFNKPSKSLDINSVQQSYDNLYTDHNSINKPSKSLDINSVQQSYDNLYTDHNLFNKPSKSLDINSVQQSYDNLYTDHNSFNNPSKSLDINSVQQSYDNLYTDHNSFNKPSKSLDINSVQQSYDNLYTDYNSINKPSKSLDINSVQQSYDIKNENNIVQNQAYITGNPYPVSQNFEMVNKLKNLGIYNQNLPNNMMNTRYQSLIRQRWPLLYQLNNRPRLLSHPLLG